MAGSSGSAFFKRYLLMAVAYCAWWQIVWELDARFNLFLFLTFLLLGLPLLFLIPGMVIVISVHCFYRRWRRAASALLACCLTVGFCRWVPHDQSWCPIDVVDQVAVPLSDWVVETRDELCGFGISAGQDIRARNTRTGQIVVLAEGDSVDETRLSSDAPNRVTIRLNNLTDVIEEAHRFGDVQVDFDYQPKDDPQERAAWQRWIWNREAPGNRAWYCKRFLSNLSKSDFDRENERLAAMIQVKDPPYCK